MLPEMPVLFTYYVEPNNAYQKMFGLTIEVKATIDKDGHVNCEIKLDTTTAFLITDMALVAHDIDKLSKYKFKRLMEPEMSQSTVEIAEQYHLTA